MNEVFDGVDLDSNALLDVKQFGAAFELAGKQVRSAKIEEAN